MESHELRLIINAAAAKVGGKQFVAAIRQVQQAVLALDRDSAGSFTKLKAEAKAAGAAARVAGKEIGAAGKAAKAGADQAAGAFAKQATAAQRATTAQAQFTASMGAAQLASERLRARLLRAGDAAGAELVTAAYNKLKVSTTGLAGNTERARASLATFKGTLTQIQVKAIETANSFGRTSAQAQALAGSAGRVAGAGNNAAGGIRNAGGAARQASRDLQTATGSMRGFENALNGAFQASSLLRNAFGAFTIGAFTSSVFQAGDALEQFKITMEVASGSIEAANSDLEFINDMASRLGTNLGAARDAFSKFAVSAQIAGVESAQTRDIFESVSTAMAVLGKGSDDQRLAFLALEQMMSKGVISAEELRRQLGERLPGAVSIMANSLGVGVDELQKMLKAGELISAEVLPKFARELDKVFGSQLDRTFNRAGSNLGRLQVEFARLLEVVASSGFLDELSGQFKDLTSLLRSSEAEEVARRIGQGMADMARMVGDAAQFIVQHFDTIATVAKTIFGGVLVRQLGLAITAMTTMAASAKTTGIAYLLFGRSAATVGSQMAATSGKLTAGAAATTLFGNASAGAAGKVKLLGAGMGLLRGAFAFMTGPIGLALTALTLLPMIFSDAGTAAENTSAQYEEAMRRMNTASFDFLDTARQIGELTVFEQLNQTLGSLSEGRVIIEQLASSGELIDSLADNMRDLTDATQGTAAAADVGGLTALVDQLMAMDQTAPEAADKVREIADAMNELNASGKLGDDFSSLQALRDTLNPLGQAVLTFNGLMAESTTIAGENGAALAELNARQAELKIAMEGLISGHIDLNALTGETAAAFDGLSNGAGIGLIGTMDQLAQRLQRISNFNGSGVRVNELVGHLRNLQFTFDGTQQSIDEYTSHLEEARQKAQQVANDNSLPQHLRDAAAAALEAINEAEAYVNSLLNLQAQSDSASSAQAGLQGAVNAAGGAMANSTAVAYNYVSALAAVASAQAAVTGIATDFRQQAALRVELSTLEGEARAVFQDRNFGTTSRAVGEINAELSELETTLNNIDGIPQDGAANFIRNQVATLSAERDALVAEGAAASSSIFQNNAARAEARRAASAAGRSGGGGGGGGGGRGGKSDAAKALEEEAKAYEQAEKAMGDYVRGLQDESIALAMVSTGRASSTEAANLLIEAQRTGVITSDAQADAFLRQARAAEELKKEMEALANDPVQKWLDSVPAWREAGQQIEVGVFESLSDSIANFIKTGEFSFEALGDSILSTVADIVADKAVKELANLFGGGEGGFGLGGMLDGLFGGGGSMGDDTGGIDLGGADQAAVIQNAHNAGGQQVAAAIQQAFSGAANQVRTGITSGGSQAATQMQTGVQTGGAVAANQVRSGVMTGAATGAPRLSQGVVTGAQQGAPILAQGVTQGSTAGGGIFGQILGGLGGGGGGGGGIGGLFTSILPMLFGAFENGGISNSPSAMVSASPSSFKNAPHFAKGTANTSGIPAILHDNEAVVPLSGGRKIPVDLGGMSGAGGGATVLNQTFNIETPDADSFRRSQSQIAADAAGAGNRALRANT